MESIEAKFVAMIMERLNALEEKNVALEQQNKQLNAQCPIAGDEELCSLER